MLSPSQGVLMALTIVFVILSFATYKKALPQPLRPLQVVMPLVALLYCVILLLAQGFLVNYIQQGLDALLDRFGFLASMFMGTLNVASACIMALLAVLLFFLIKTIIFAIFKRIENSLPNTLLNYFRDLFGFAFEWKKSGEMWSIKDEYRAMGKLAGWLYLVVLVVCSALLFLFPSTIALYSPCYGVLIFGEIACFLQAPPCTVTKPTGSLDYDASSTRVARYDLLTEAYKEFDNRIVGMEKEVGRPSRVTANHNVVTPLLESESLEDNLAGQYLKSLQLMGEDLDGDKAYMLQRLLHGENVVCASPFYWDFGRYILFPLVRELSHGNKAMVLCGSDIRMEDVKAWLEKEIGFISGVEELWRVGSLFECHEDEEIDICCMNVNDANRQNELLEHEDFLTATRFVLLLNPSTSFSSAQVGLGLLARTLGGNHQVTYCICDKNTNGLVDSLSHALRANFVEVECPRVPEGTVCSVIWKAEDPEGISMHHQLFGEIAQYLGLGTEIATVAAKHGISNITWTGQSNVPLQDMRWIAQQYYRKICAYADLDASASALDDHISYKSGMWDSQTEDFAFYVVEDEGANAFEVLRRFSSRGREDAFINVVSPNYLLRDYMAENSHLFLADPKAIPHIIPDYANTLRNNALSLFARLSCGPVLVEEVKKSLTLAGMGNGDVTATLMMLASMYLDVDCSTEALRSSIFIEEMQVGIDPETLCYKKDRFVKLSKDHPLEWACKSILAQSFYICEDEELNKNVLGSCLTGHMYQNVLPGQGIVLEGKYYEVLSIDAEGEGNRVLLRRAADHFTERSQYCQVKSAFIDNWRSSNRLNRTREYSNMRIELAEANIVISTEGYLKMEDASNFKTARFVRMSTIPERTYRNKTALKVSFDGANGATPEVLATLTVLLNGLFRTVYNENAKYILVGSVAAQESDFPKGSYTLLESEELDENAIYIMEDSSIDLGLIDSVDRNILKFLSIIEDYLSWHSDRLKREWVEEPKEAEDDFVLDIPEEVFELVATVARLSLWERVKQFLMGYRKKKDKTDLGIEEVEKGKKGEEEEAPVAVPVAPAPVAPAAEPAPVAPAPEPTPAAEPAPAPEPTPVAEPIPVSAPEPIGALVDDEPTLEPLFDPAAETAPETKESADETNVWWSTSSNANDDGIGKGLANIRLIPKKVLASQTNQPVAYGYAASAAEPEEKDWYKRVNFLKFGQETYPESLAVDETLDFLHGLGVYSADLHQARKDAQERHKEQLVVPEGAHCCDFCGEPIMTLEYDVLDDGRERCIRCAREAITSLDEFERVYAEVRKTMCSLYHINLPASITIKMTTADDIAKHTGSRFVATDGFDARAVGVAIRAGRGNYTLLVENGTPRISAIGTLAHELTHIWQYENWDDKDIIGHYGKTNSLAIYEGMAVLSEVQYLFSTNNKTIAVKRLMNEIQRNDVYGAGLRKYYLAYGVDTKPSPALTKDHPFQHGSRPL